MRKFLLLFLLLSAAGIAQTFDFEGKTYLVYPIVLETEYEGVDTSKVKKERAYRHFESTNVSSVDIPPIISTIKDGTYVLLDRPKEVFPDTTIMHKEVVRAVFNIKLNRFNGKATLYNLKGEKTEEGNYLDGLKSGVWKSFGKDEKYYDTYSYIKGRREGYYKKYSLLEGKPYLIEKGIEGDGYDETDTVFAYAVDSSGAVYKSEEYCGSHYAVKNYYRTFYPNGKIKLKIDPLEFKRDCAISIGSNYAEYGEYDLVSFRSNQSVIPLLEKFGGLPEKVRFFAYHSNGRLFGEFKNYKSYEIEKAEFDTLFHYNGAIYLLKSNYSDTLNRKRQIIQRFDINGKTEAKILMIDDLNYQTTIYEKQIDRNGKLKTVNANYELLYELARENDKNYVPKDSLILTHISTTKYGLRSVYKSPLIGPQRFYRLQEGPYQLDFKILKYDSVFYKFQYVAQLGDLKAVLTANAKEEKTLRLNNDISRLMNIIRPSDRKDSIFFYYKDKPFTGEVNLVFSADTFKVKKEGKKLLVNVLPLFGKKLSKAEIDNDSSHFVITLKDGMISYVDFELVTQEGIARGASAFANNFPDGHAFVEFDGISKRKQKNKRIRRKDFGRCEADFSNGNLNGAVKIWAWSRDEDTIKLIKKENYSEGFLNDTSFSFSGGTSYMIYNMGELKCTMLGDDTKGTRTYRFYDRLNARSKEYTLNSKNDTIAFANFFNDKIHGKAMAQVEDGKGYIISYFDSAEVSKQISYYDENNVLRLFIEIDSCHESAYAPIQWENPMTAWENQIDFAGKVKMYYPNGQLYFEGKTKMDRKVHTYTGYNGSGECEDKGILANTEYKHTSIEYLMYRCGLWKYYTIDGKLWKEVDYKKGNRNASLEISPSKMITGELANYKEYYPSGAIKYVGIVTKEDINSNCDLGIPEDNRSIVYKSYLKEDGTSVVALGTGKIQVFHINGVLKMEGNVVNGNWSGLYKEYNSDGKLITIGKYLKGEKHGRWLEGDVEGFNYDDVRCFESLEAQKEHERNEFNTIEIQESYYNNGYQYSSNRYTFKRSLK